MGLLSRGIYYVKISFQSKLSDKRMDLLSEIYCNIHVFYMLIKYNIKISKECNFQLKIWQIFIVSFTLYLIVSIFFFLFLYLFIHLLSSSPFSYYSYMFFLYFSFLFSLFFLFIHFSSSYPSLSPPLSLYFFDYTFSSPSLSLSSPSSSFSLSSLPSSLNLG